MDKGRIATKQREVLSLILQGVSFKQIALSMSMKLNKVYKAKDRLMKKGILEQTKRGEYKLTELGGKSQLTIKNGANFFLDQINWTRLHFEQITIRILSHSPQWLKTKNSIFYLNANQNEDGFKAPRFSQELDLNGNLITCYIYRESVVIYLPEVTRSRAKDAIHDAHTILLKIIRQIEARFPITLLKNGYCSMEISKNHYALIHNEVAGSYKEEKKDLRIYNKDNELRLLIDFSENSEGVKTPELEGVHTITGAEDIVKLERLMENLKKNPQFWNDWLDNGFIAEDFKHMKEALGVIMGVQSAYAEQIKKHLLVQEGTLKTQKETLQTLKLMRKAIRETTKVTPIKTSKAPDCSLREWL